MCKLKAMSLIKDCHEIFKPITKGIIDVEWGVMANKKWFCNQVMNNIQRENLYNIK